MKRKTIKFQGEQDASEKDIELVRMIADEMRPKEIAKARGVSPKTIEAQVFALKKKFSKKTVPGLVMLFVRNKLID